MDPSKPLLLIPVENQVRELDPKLLLASVAARRGFDSIIGSRREIHFHIKKFPRGIYVSKSVTSASDMMFKILHKLGHAMVAWDEEALVHLPAQIYYSRRLSPVAMRLVSHFFAWGEDNAELWREYPEFPVGIPLHVTGNPRCDLLRPEMSVFYEDQAQDIRNRFGDFILVNTNFNHVNAFSPVQNLFQPHARLGEKPKFGRAAQGMTPEYAEGLRNLKQGVFEAFQKLIPELERAFPKTPIVVRPHPTENPHVYEKIADLCKQVRVTNEGNIVPWLMATRVVIHNGCTTGVEAFVMGVPAISYRAVVAEEYDYGFYRLPNLVSHQCFCFEELYSTLQKVFAGELGVADGDERTALVDRYIASRTGPLACERIVDVLEAMVNGGSPRPVPAVLTWLHGQTWASFRTLVKQTKARLPGSHNKPEFQQHRYPQVSLGEMRARVARFQQILCADDELKVEPKYGRFFQIGI